MESRPPASILLAIASATILGLTGIAALGWTSFRWLSGGNPAVRPSVMGILGIVALAVFIERTLRRRRNARVAAIAIALPVACIFAVFTLMFAVAPAIADRWMSVAMMGMFTLLLSLIAAPLLRSSARAWLSQ
jgi:hypothetical protein